jgi:tRNA(fMet)-specific endonuclease VapC
MATSPLYLLDTNILVHGVRRSKTWGAIKATWDPLMTDLKPIYSVVTEAELLSFARQRSWDESKRNQATFLLSSFTRIGIESPEIIEAYSEIDTYSRFRPEGAVKMGKNDLWIAATAFALNATIVTTDADFDHLNGKYIHRVYIAQVS